MNIRKPVNNIKKDDFFKKVKNDYPNDEEIEQTTEVIKNFNI